MTKKVFNMQGGLHSAAAFTAFENAAWGNCVANLDSFKVTNGAGMSVNIAPGDGIIATANSGKRIQTDATETATVAAANPSFSRVDTVVAYIDSSVSPTTTVVDNTNNILKFAVVTGTPSTVPTAPTQSMIQSAIGASNDYMPLCDVRIPIGATALNNATFTDRRNVITIISTSQIADNSITTAKLQNNSVKANKIDMSSFSTTSETVSINGLSWKFSKSRGIVSCAVSGITTLAGDQNNVGTIPAQFRPANSDAYISMYALNSGRINGYGFYRASISGTVKVSSTGGYNEWYGSGVWIGQS